MEFNNRLKKAAKDFESTPEEITAALLDYRTFSKLKLADKNEKKKREEHDIKINRIIHRQHVVTGIISAYLFKYKPFADVKISDAHKFAHSVSRDIRNFLHGFDALTDDEVNNLYLITDEDNLSPAYFADLISDNRKKVWNGPAK